ncbi:unnamed protein product [Pleuronectes platessa]|uniref:EGF-like domain-containing protein n=1 Tax=Pleuronectes platessa TaxID=8262 RepID=A0A9N7YUQ0_PLEPL|nr:unnamed protein product [Pleuronectes platessa]
MDKRRWPPAPPPSSALCGKDIDECAERLIECHNHSRCVNLPGWYHCECRSGFHDNGSYLLDGSSCIEGLMKKERPDMKTYWIQALGSGYGDRM